MVIVACNIDLAMIAELSAPSTFGGVSPLAIVMARLTMELDVQLRDSRGTYPSRFPLLGWECQHRDAPDFD